MNKKILLIIIVIAIVLIGFGLIFTFIVGDNSNSGPIVDVNAELEKNEDIHMENVYRFSSLDDAIEYLKSTFETENVVVSENDDFVAKIKVLSGTDEEIVYNYIINGGDLVIGD